MSTYSEKQATIHLVTESDQDFENKWYEIRVDDVEISKGDTLQEAIEYCPKAISL